MKKYKEQKEQVERIKLKLEAAKAVDIDFKVFGAKYHQYFIGEPLSSKLIDDFESKYRVFLPECYKLFLTEIGNGGCSDRDSAAGPFYGIYPLGWNIDEFNPIFPRIFGPS